MCLRLVPALQEEASRVMLLCCRWLVSVQVLRQGRMTRSAAFTAAVSSPGQGAGGNRSSGRPLTGAAHLMLNIQLTGFSASGEQLATNLTFVELAAPEAKVRQGCHGPQQCQAHKSGSICALSVPW